MSFRRFSHRLRSLLPAGAPPCVLLDTVDSTNLLARRILAGYRASGSPPPPMILVAYHQSRGRGRGSHVWVSPAGAGLYASLLLPAVAPEQLASLPLLAAVGLARGLEPLVGRRVALRWPNDLLVAGRKLGGVLIEAMTAPGREVAAVVGIGVNHERPAVAGATSIRDERRRPRPASDGPEERAEVGWRLLAAVRSELERLDDAAYAARAYAAASAHRSGDSLRCRTPAGTVEGRFVGFDDRGFLRLETADGPRSLGAGELISAGE